MLRCLALKLQFDALQHLLGREYRQVAAGTGQGNNNTEEGATCRLFVVCMHCVLQSLVVHGLLQPICRLPIQKGLKIDAVGES